MLISIESYGLAGQRSRFYAINLTKPPYARLACADLVVRVGDKIEVDFDLHSGVFSVDYDCQRSAYWADLERERKSVGDKDKDQPTDCQA